MATKYFCDRCGAEGGAGMWEIVYHTFRSNGKSICSACQRDFDAWMKRAPTPSNR